MTFPALASLNEDECPVPEALFRQVRGAEPPNAAMIASTLPQAQRARLAVFCYRKRHLHELGLTHTYTLRMGTQSHAVLDKLTVQIARAIDNLDELDVKSSQLVYKAIGESGMDEAAKAQLTSSVDGWQAWT